MHPESGLSNQIAGKLIITFPCYVTSRSIFTYYTHVCKTTAFETRLEQTTRRRARASSSPSVSVFFFRSRSVKVQVGNKVFRQRIGIPMGTDCATLLANLFLFYYEYNYMKSLLKNNFLLARKFNNTARNIDDLLTLNNTHFGNAKYIIPY